MSRLYVSRGKSKIKVAHNNNNKKQKSIRISVQSNMLFIPSINRLYAN